MTPAVIEQVRRNLATLDLSIEQAEIAELDRKIAANEDATRRGQAEMQAALQAAREERQPNGAAVAEALRSNAAIAGDVMTANKWQERADQLRAGLRSLADSNAALTEGKRAADQRMAAKVMKALLPLYEAQRQRAQAAFDTLVSIRAAVECLHLARLGDPELRRDLEEVAVRDLGGCLKRPATQQPVPEWIKAIAPDLAKLGPAFRRTAMLDSVQL